MNEQCPCPKKSCRRYGDCDECRAHHLKKKSYPFCERDDLIEKKK
jgi:hypothetical protein